jgi:hypothetical protein
VTRAATDARAWAEPDGASVSPTESGIWTRNDLESSEVVVDGTGKLGTSRSSRASVSAVGPSVSLTYPQNRDGAKLKDDLESSGNGEVDGEVVVTSIFTISPISLISLLSTQIVCTHARRRTHARRFGPGYGNGDMDHDGEVAR